MLRRLALVAALLLFMLQVSAGQAVSHAYAGDDGKVRLVYANGAVKIIPFEQQQVGSDHISIAPDRRTVAWLLLVENCCTSYPIATGVVVYRDGKKIVIYSDQMIYEWQFVGQGGRISVLSGPVHGNAAQAGLYDARTGKLLASWSGKGAVPAWAEAWKNDFGN